MAIFFNIATTEQYSKFIQSVIRGNDKFAFWKLGYFFIKIIQFDNYKMISINFDFYLPSSYKWIEKKINNIESISIRGLSKIEAIFYYSLVL